jgi:hypothetical protein
MVIIVPVLKDPEVNLVKMSTFFHNNRIRSSIVFEPPLLNPYSSPPACHPPPHPQTSSPQHVDDVDPPMQSKLKFETNRPGPRKPKEIPTPSGDSSLKFAPIFSFQTNLDIMTPSGRTSYKIPASEASLATISPIFDAMKQLKISPKVKK